MEARRDWAYPRDQVELMWRILQAKVPGDFVDATGEVHSGREFAQATFEAAGIDQWEKYLGSGAVFSRPSEVFNLRGTAAKAKREIG